MRCGHCRRGCGDPHHLVHHSVATMFRKKIQNSINRPSKRRGGSLVGTLAVIIGMSFLLLMCVWCMALLSSISTNNQVPNNSQKQALSEFRVQFHERYGDAAGSILEHGMQRFGDIRHTANRILQSKQSKTDFSMSFAGYSVTVGRGNRLEESVCICFWLNAIISP